MHVHQLRLGDREMGTDSTTHYDGSTWLYLTLVHYTIAKPGSPCLYYTLPWLYYILPWIHVTLLDSTTLYHGSTWLYYILPWLYLIVHDSITFFHAVSTVPFHP